MSDPSNRFPVSVPLPVPVRPSLIGSPPPGGNPIERQTGGQERARSRRNAIVARASTRIDGNRFPISPLWLVVVDWPRERCPTCDDQLFEGMQVAFDEDERACFCLPCARKWLDHEPDDDDPPPARPTSTVQLTLEL